MVLGDVCCVSRERIQFSTYLWCAVTKCIFAAMGNLRHCKKPISNASLADFLVSWASLNSHHHYTPFFVFWCVWNARNKVIFEEKRISPGVLTCKVSQLILRFPVLERRIKIWIIGPAPVLAYPIDFFNGAATKEMGGARVYIEISHVHSFHIKLGCGPSTNMRAELLALWSLLYWEKMLGLPSLNIFGDSLVIINWENGKAASACLDLDNWCEAIRQMIRNFLSLDLQHVYREHKQSTYGFSKEALVLDSGICLISEFYDDYVIQSGEFKLF